MLEVFFLSFFFNFGCHTIGHIDTSTTQLFIFYMFNMCEQQSILSVCCI